MILLDVGARPVIGHRGASGECPENTVLAFDRALEQGADAIELDVRLTADGVPVVLHDATVDRTTDGMGAVATRTLAQLRQLDAGRGERIPTLAEVLGRYPTTPVVVELKDPAAGPAVARALDAAGAVGRALVGAFDHAALGAFREAPFVRAASRRETAVFWAASRLGLAVPGGYRAFTIPERHRGLPVADAALVHAARRRGKPVHVWTVDDPADARRLRALGVAGIITNFPARMRAL